MKSAFPFLFGALFMHCVWTCKSSREAAFPSQTSRDTVRSAALVASGLSFGIAPKVSRPVRRDSAVIAYVERFSPVAVSEWRRFGIPASVTLSQGILESDAGRSHLARRARNHFGMKCFSKRCGRGHCVNKADDSHKDFFIVFRSAWYSYRAHSKFLLQRRYKDLPFGRADIPGWCDGLQSAGYATSKTYSTKLQGIIKTYDLEKYDR
jgi:flagellum-specific peptidoglycan hydrolase FlgJ